VQRDIEGAFQDRIHDARTQLEEDEDEEEEEEEEEEEGEENQTTAEEGEGLSVPRVLYRVTYAK
jgi:CO dehydrogenase/acetyl-CoA synthase beta subunit